MLNIALCDDEPIYLDNICKELEVILGLLEFKASRFNKADDLIDYLYATSFDSDKIDIVLLDIDMPDSNGIEIAQKLLEKDTDMIIIFVTNRSELVFEALRIRPFRFVRKNLLEEELNEAIKSAMNKIYNETIIVDFMGEKNVHKFMVRNIIYIESSGHYINVVLNDEIVTVRKKISDYEDRLSKFGFIRTHNSYLVNVRCIKSINKDGITMDNGDILAIRKGKIEEIKRKYMAGIRRFIDG